MDNGRLIVKGFMGLDNVAIELSGLNIFIGPQASGKSVIAKLISFFEGIPSKHYLPGIYSGNNKRSLDAGIRQEFEEIFPKYSWMGQSFLVSYFNGEFELSLKGVQFGGRSKSTKLVIEYPEEIKKIYGYLKRQFELNCSDDEDQEGYTYSFKKGELFEEKVVTSLLKKEIYSVFRQQYFIPASRSYFSNLQSSLFSVLANNLDIDPFLKEFGSLYENSKFAYKRKLSGVAGKKQEKIMKIMEKTVKGKYEKLDGKDWIVDSNKRTGLSNSSSGQQEALPMMMVLATLPFYGFFSTRYARAWRGENRQKLLIVEEPEAHLFPSAQKDIVDALSILASMNETRVIATTHSPYILSALNNLLQGGEVIRKKPDKKREIEKLLYPGECLNVQYVRAYSVNDGKVTNIVDDEFGLIGQSIIDEVSDSFASIFTDLLEASE